MPFSLFTIPLIQLFFFFPYLQPSLPLSLPASLSPSLCFVAWELSVAFALTHTQGSDSKQVPLL